MAMKNEDKHDADRKEKNQNNVRKFSEGLKEDNLRSQGGSQGHGRVLVVTESSIVDIMEFSDPDRVKCANLHDAGSWVRKGGISKLFIIGSSDYYHHVVHDLGHWQPTKEIGLVFLQTDGTKIDKGHLRENTVLLNLPIDAKKISEAIDIKVTIKSLEDEAPENKTIQKVLIVTDSDEISKSMMRALKFVAEIESEACTHSEFSNKSDVGRYKRIIVINSGEQRSYSRDILTSRHAMGAKNKGIYMSYDVDDTAREGEICMKMPFNLANLIEELKR